MDKLPPEILSDIFLKTLPHALDELKHYNRYSESVLAPLRVSHVCRSWREIALSFRELWSYLHIDSTDFSDQMRRKRMVDIFDTWLARTNDGPINFTIGCHFPIGATIIQEHECAEYIFTTLVGNQHRWKDVYFYCYGVEFSPRFPGFSLTNMPILTSLSLNMCQSLHSVVNLSPSLRLRHLTHNNVDLMAVSRLPRLEYATLIFPNRHPAPEIGQIVGPCLKLLKSAPSLVNFWVTAYSKSSLPPLLMDEEHILHTGLRRLRLEAHCSGVLPAVVLDSVTLPHLEQFIYYSKIGENLLRFFQRSMPPLASLELCESDASEDSLIRILRLLSTLKELRLSEVKLSHRFFSELIVPGGTSDDRSAFRKQVVCPLLSFFQVHGWVSGRDTGLETLITMAKSRASVLGTFQTAGFYANGYRVVATGEVDKYADIISPFNGFTLSQIDDGSHGNTSG